MGLRMDPREWLGKIRGHVSEANKNFKADAKERQAAEKAPNSIIFNREEIRNSYWDPAKVLFTTLGGTYRPINLNDIRVFQANMRRYHEAVNHDIDKNKEIHRTAGITARQVINLASSKPLTYVHQEQYRSDIDKARREITSAIPVSALGNTVRFLTNAGKDSADTRHVVVVQFLEFDQALSKLYATDKKLKRTPAQLANQIRKGYLKFDCDCGRHRYFFRFLATVGNYNAGRPEEGYPKIRNPDLKGVACKHVLRVMAELESSQTTLRFLTRHLEKVAEGINKTQMKQKEVEAELKNKNPTRIKTSEQRKAEALRRKEIRAMQRAVKNKKPTQPMPTKKPTISRKKPMPEPSKTDWKSGLTAKDIALVKRVAKLYGVTPQEIAALKKGK